MKKEGDFWISDPPYTARGAKIFDGEGDTIIELLGNVREEYAIIFAKLLNDAEREGHLEVTKANEVILVKKEVS